MNIYRQVEEIGLLLLESMPVECKSSALVAKDVGFDTVEHTYSQSWPDRADTTLAPPRHIWHRITELVFDWFQESRSLGDNWSEARVVAVPTGKFDVEYKYEGVTAASSPFDAQTIGARQRDLHLVGGDAIPPSDFVAQSLAGLQLQTAAHDAAWGIGSVARWNLDLAKGEISFVCADGRLVVAEAQIVGTFNPREQTFLWGWDHPSVPEPMRAHARLTREWAEQHKVSDWLAREVHCTEEDAWKFTAVTARLGEANGAYRAPSDGPLVYLTFGELTMSAPTSA